MLESTPATTSPRCALGVRLFSSVAAAWALGCAGAGASSPAEPTVATSSAAPEREDSSDPPGGLAEGVEGEAALVSRGDSDWVAVGGFDLAFRLPSGWHRVSAERLQANRDRMLRGASAELVSRGSDAWRRTFQVGATATPPEESVGLVPTIQVSLRRLPSEIPASALCMATHQELARSMPGATLAANEAAALGPVQGHRCVVRYVLTTTTGDHAAQAEVYFAMRGTLMLQMSFSGPAPLDRAPVQAVLGSIRPLE